MVIREVHGLAEAFKFGLDKLLEMRVEKEEEHKRLFTQTQREKKNIENELDNLKTNYNKYKGINGNEDVVYQKLKKYYLQGLQGGIQATEKKLTQKIKEVDTRRKELTESQIKRKTVETLKDKKYAAYLKEQNRIEQINIDELALYAYMRNHNSKL